MDPTPVLIPATALIEPQMVMLERLRQMLVDRLRTQRALCVKYLQLAQSKRFYAAYWSARMSRLWDEDVRSDVELTGFVLDLTMEFDFRCRALLNDQGGDLAKWLGLWFADSYGAVTRAGGLMDDDTAKPFLKHEDIVAAYERNMWYTVLHLTSMCGIFTLLVEVVEAQSGP